MKSILITIMAFLFMSAQAQQEKIIETGEFTKVKVGSQVNAKFIPSDRNYVSFTSDENQSGGNIKFEAEVKSGLLELTSKGEVVNANIFVKTLDYIDISGNGQAGSEDKISGGYLKIKASGAGAINMNMNYGKVEVVNSGAADVIFKGKIDTLLVEASGASHINAFDTENVYTKVNASGASDVKVNPDSALVADISGVSSLKYKKEPRVKEIKSSSMADENVETEYISILEDNDIDVEHNDDTTKIKMYDKEIVIVEGNDDIKVLRKPNLGKKSKKFRGNWSGLEFGINGYLTPDHSMILPAEYNYLELDYPKSINFNFNIFQQSVRIIGNKFGLVTGLGFSWYNFKFNSKNTVLSTDSAFLTGYLDTDPSKSYIKSKLTASYITVPLLLEFQTNSKHKSNSFHLSAGVIGGVRLGSHTKQVYTVNGSGEYKPKVKDNFFLQPFKADATARIGWGPINLYATYSLIEMFNPGQGPELYPFTVGFILPLGD